MEAKKKFCKCGNESTLTSEIEEFGYWDVCCSCGLPLENGYHYFNHFDGDDHDDIDF